MGIREVKEQKYTVKLQCVTWHAANEWVYEGKKSINYSDIDGDDCYFHRLHEYLEAGWQVMRLGAQSIVMTGDVYPVENYNREKGVRKALAHYIYAYPERWQGQEPDRPRICGQEDKIVRYPWIISSSKVDKVIEEVLEELRKRPMKDFIESLND